MIYKCYLHFEHPDDDLTGWHLCWYLLGLPDRHGVESQSHFARSTVHHSRQPDRRDGPSWKDQCHPYCPTHHRYYISILTSKCGHTWVRHLFNAGLFIFSLFVGTNADEGLKFAFDVRTTLNVSHVIFHPSTTSHSYDLYATSADKGDVLFLNLEAGENFKFNFRLKLLYRPTKKLQNFIRLNRKSWYHYGSG